MRRDFNAFVRLSEKYGRKDIKSIAKEMEGKTEDEVRQYADVFWKRFGELNGEARFPPMPTQPLLGSRPWSHLCAPGRIRISGALWRHVCT